MGSEAHLVGAEGQMIGLVVELVSSLSLFYRPEQSGCRERLVSCCLQCLVSQKSIKREIFCIFPTLWEH